MIDRARTVRDGTWYRLLGEVPELESLYRKAIVLGEVYSEVPDCRYRIWKRWLEERAQKLLGSMTGERNLERWGEVPDPELASRLRSAEYDIVRHNLMDVLPACPPDCNCKTRDERMTQEALAGTDVEPGVRFRERSK